MVSYLVKILQLVTGTIEKSYHIVVIHLGLQLLQLPQLQNDQQ